MITRIMMRENVDYKRYVPSELDKTKILNHLREKKCSVPVEDFTKYFKSYNHMLTTLTYLLRRKVLELTYNGKKVRIKEND